MAVGEQDQRRVAVAVPATARAGGLAEAPDLLGGEELAGADVGVAARLLTSALVVEFR